MLFWWILFWTLSDPERTAPEMTEPAAVRAAHHGFCDPRRCH